MSDDFIPTIVISDQGELPFQEYFVRRKCKPAVSGFRFKGIDSAQSANGVIEAIQQAEILVICPSNPWVSIDPILAVPGIKGVIRNRLKTGKTKYGKTIAVSPIIGGEAVKGPAAKMYQELGIEPSAVNVARHYGNLIDGFVFDRIDFKLEKRIRKMGLATLCTNTLMNTSPDRERLAREILDFFNWHLSDKIYHR
jgi:LPPG:FO 2-phospho-L-lactate transferase